MRHVWLLLIFTGLAFAQAVSPIPPDAQAALKELRKEPFRAHMAFLADDLLEGRGTGTRGHEIAARYVAAQFEAIGLKPAGENGSYYQRVPFRQITVDPDKCSMRSPRMDRRGNSNGAMTSSLGEMRSKKILRSKLPWYLLDTA